MVTASARHNNFDLLRLCAATQVVWDHTTTHLALYTLPFVSAVLDALPGVPIFFVISGYLISLSYERSLASGSAISYYRNRILRIYPALWTAFLCSVVTVVIISPSAFREADAIVLVKWILAQLTVVQYYNPAFLRHFGVGVLNGSLWTIPVELEFYAAVPVLYGMLRLASGSRKNPVLLMLLGLCLGFHLAFASVPASLEHSVVYKLLKVSLAPYLYIFITGILIQRNISVLRRYLEGKAIFWLVGYTVACTIASRIGWAVHGNGFPVTLMFILALTVVSCAFSAPSLTERMLRGRDLSYGIYVYHMIVVNIFVQLGSRGAGWGVGTATVAIVYALAFLSWTCVEAPALALRGRLKKTPKPLLDAV